MKKMLKIIGVVLVSIVDLIAAAVVFLIVKNKIDSGKAWLADDYYMAFQSDSALEKKYAGIGTYDVSNTVIKSGDNVIKNIRIWYPAELENKTGQYPMIIVVNGSNTAALNYEAFFKRLASWGFIVVGNDDRQTGTGLSASATLEYMLSLGNDKSSIFYEKSVRRISVLSVILKAAREQSGQLRNMETAVSLKQFLREAPRIRCLQKIWGGNMMFPK